MELKKPGVSEITVKMLTSGRYTWTIGITFDTGTEREAIETLRSIDRQLKDRFPEHVQRGTGRISNLDEE